MRLRNERAKFAGALALLAAFGWVTAGCSGQKKPLEGSVTITVMNDDGSTTPKIGSTLTVDTSALNGSGEFSYEWYRDGEKIEGAESSAYRLDGSNKDAQIIEVKVSDAKYTESRSASISAAASFEFPTLSNTVIRTKVDVSNLPVSNGKDVRFVVYGAKQKKWVACFDTYNDIAVSEDGGATWSTPQNVHLYDMIGYGNGRWVLTGHYEKINGIESYTAVSDDGVTWTEQKIGDASFGFDRIVYNGSTWLGVAPSQTGTSTDGTNWKLQNTTNYDVRKKCYDLIAANNQYIMVGNFNESIKTSANGISWESAGTWKYQNDAINYCAFNSGVLVAGNWEILAWSDINKDKSLTVSSSAYAIFKAGVYAVAYACGRWIAVGEDGKAAESLDGKTWTAFETGTTEDLYSIAYGGGRWVIGGTNGSIFYMNEAAAASE